MIRRICFSALFASLLVASVGRSVQAYEPGFQFAFGYAIGQANQFRNRLPAPPYFSVFPPVYYGQRYERPYGESPFASWPLLQANANYQPQPQSAPVHVYNPHLAPATPCDSCGSPVTQMESEAAGKMVTIENPFVRSNASLAAASQGK